MNLINAAISGIGTYIPNRILTNQDLESIVNTNNDWIVSRTGIKERRIADPGQATSDLASIAGKRAIDDAGITPEDVDLIIVATATPDMGFPATACIVQEEIGAKNAAAFDIGAGCTGFIYALAMGNQFVITGVYKNVLVIGAETLSKVTNWEDRRTCVLLADGAGAVVLKSAPYGQGILSFHLGADGSGQKHIYQPAGGSRMPASIETVSQNLHKLRMNGQEVFKFASKVFVDATLKALDNASMKKTDIDVLIPHQANFRIIESGVKRLGLPMEKVIVNIDRFGNTSSASIPLALEEALNEERIKNDDNVVLVAFGAGLTWGAMVIKWVI
jgi:3-oxoacyl-[acyl-carrier-protein] synthase-3